MYNSTSSPPQFSIHKAENSMHAFPYQKIEQQNGRWLPIIWKAKPYTSWFLKHTDSQVFNSTKLHRFSHINSTFENEERNETPLMKIHTEALKNLVLLQWWWNMFACRRHSGIWQTTLSQRAWELTHPLALPRPHLIILISIWMQKKGEQSTSSPWVSEWASEFNMRLWRLLTLGWGQL